MSLADLSRQISELRDSLSNLRNEVGRNYIELQGERTLSDQLYTGPIKDQVAALAEGLRESEREVDALEREVSREFQSIASKVSAMNVAIKFLLGLSITNTVLLLWNLIL